MSMMLMFGDGSFNPRSLFAANEQGAWYDPSDFSTLYQDSAGTTPVTAVGQPVGRINDKSGRGNPATQATAGNRPVLRQDSSGRYYLEFDGATSNRWLQTSSIDFTGTDKMTVWAGVRKLSDAALGMICELSTDAATLNGFYVAGPGGTAAATYRIAVGTPSAQIISSATLAAPVTNVLAVSYDKAQSTSSSAMSLRVNGALNAYGVGVEGDPAGNFANAALYIGRRAGTALPFNGRLYGLIVRGAASNASQIAAAESWMNSKTGAY